jgi:hypothetical protein
VRHIGDVKLRGAHLSLKPRQHTDSEDPRHKSVRHIGDVCCRQHTPGGWAGLSTGAPRLRFFACLNLASSALVARFRKKSLRSKSHRFFCHRFAFRLHIYVKEGFWKCAFDAPGDACGLIPLQSREASGRRGWHCWALGPYATAVTTPEAERHGTMTGAAVHDAFRHELWRVFRDQPLGGLLDFSVH